MSRKLRPARKSAQRAGLPTRAPVTTSHVMTWLDEQLAADPALRRRVARVLAALRKEQATPVRRRRMR